MAKPSTKEELLVLCEANFTKLLHLPEGYSSEQLHKEFPEGSLNRNVRDVLAHLHEWHVMFLDWYAVGMTGEKPDMPAKGYTWKMMPDLNRKINADYQQHTLAEAKELLLEYYPNIPAVIEKHADEELFTRKKYKWTGDTSLGVYLISNTSSYCDWAIKFIKKGMKGVQ
jgi:hypothetical protein